MQDCESRVKDLESHWDRLVAAIRQSWEDRADDDYFHGVYEGLMWALAELSVLMGRTHEYAALCKELDGIEWCGYGG